MFENKTRDTADSTSIDDNVYNGKRKINEPNKNLYNSNTMTDDWISLNLQQNFNRRNEHFQIFKIANYKVGRNLMTNRFHPLNNKIKYSWLNDSFESYKIKCKTLLLS